MLLRYKERVDALIQGYIAECSASGRLQEACAYALLSSGKRFRPILVQMVAQALGRPNDADEAALAIELFHTSSLIADDLPCMDDDDERRNRPSLHRAFDEATALLASYALISAGYGCIGRNSVRLGDRGGKVCALALENVAYNTGLEGAAGGQWLDLFPPDLSEATIRQVLQMKTVSLFEISFVLGWLFAGGDLGRVDEVKRAAYHFGMAFQIADDWDDVDQDALNERKVNLVAVVGRLAAKAAFQEALEGYRGDLTSLGIASDELLQLAVWLEQKVR